LRFVECLLAADPHEAGDDIRPAPADRPGDILHEHPMTAHRLDVSIERRRFRPLVRDAPRFHAVDEEPPVPGSV